MGAVGGRDKEKGEDEGATPRRPLPVAEAGGEGVLLLASELTTSPVARAAF